MNIIICLNNKEFYDDAQLLVRSFFIGSKISYCKSEGFEKKSVIEKTEENIELYLPSLEVKESERIGKSKGEIHDIFKKRLYNILLEYTKTELPWGILTGVRPTKRVISLLKECTSDNESERKKFAITALKEKYNVSNRKALLAYETAINEQEIIEKNNPDSGISLYVHIPFCPSVCAYCSFASTSVKHCPPDIVDEYTEALCREITECSSLAKGKRIDTVYFGGGTPTSLNTEQLKRIMSCIHENYDLSKVREITVEAGRPDSITEEKLKCIKEYGATRISINPQSMNEKTLKAIGRDHSPEDVYYAFALARKVGFKNINSDLIMGLPDENEDDIQNTANHIKKLFPDSITVHSLAMKRAAKFTVEHDKYKGYSFASDEKLKDILADVAKHIDAKPYYMYRQQSMVGNLENVGYARKGAECLYNIYIMEEIQSILAFGSGSSSKFIFDKCDKKGHNIQRSENVKNIKEYIKRVDECISKKFAIIEEYGV